MPRTVLGAMSKALATLCTQPLIVAKVGLQSKPPPERQGRAFKTFGEVMRHVVDHEGVARLFKGVGPQLLKGILVQGILNMTKERSVSPFLMAAGKTDDEQDRDLRAAAAAVRPEAARRAPGQAGEQAVSGAGPEPGDPEVIRMERSSGDCCIDSVRSCSGVAVFPCKMVDGSDFGCMGQASSLFYRYIHDWTQTTPSLSRT